MPLYRITAPNGQTYQIEGPEGASDAEVAQAVLAQYPEAGVPVKQSTILGEVARGFKQMGSSARTAAGQIGSQEDADTAAKAGVQRSQQISQETGEGPGLAAVQRAYRERGALPAAGEAISQIPRALAGQTANLGAAYAGAKLGSKLGAPFGAPGRLIGGGLGAAAAMFPGFMGANVEQQAEAQTARGEPVSIERGRAATAAAGQAAVESLGTGFTLGKGVVKSVLGIADDAALLAAKSQQELLKTAQRSLAGTVGRGALRGTAEMPVELAQAVIGRAQARQPLTGDDAYAEYAEALYGALLVGSPLGGAGNIATRSQARDALAAQAAQEPPKPQAPPAAETGAGPTAPPATPTTYGELKQREQALLQEEQTPEIKQELAAIRAELRKLNLADLEAPMEQARIAREQEAQAKAAGAPAAQSAGVFAQEEPQQIEMREALAEEPLPEQTDLFGKPLAPAPDQAEPTLGDLVDGVPLTTEALTDAGMMPSRSQLRKEGQMSLPLEEGAAPEAEPEAPVLKKAQAPKPKKQPPTQPEAGEVLQPTEEPAPGVFTEQDVKDTGIAPRTSMKWFLDNVVGKTEEEVRAMVAADPKLVEGPGQRAKILQALTQPKVPAFQETPNAPEVAQPEATAGVEEPAAVAVPVDTGAGAGAAVPVPPTKRTRAKRAKAPEQPGVAPAGQPAVPADGGAPESAPALTQETADEEAARLREAEEEAARPREAEEIRQRMAEVAKAKPAPPKAAKGPEPRVEKPAPKEIPEKLYEPVGTSEFGMEEGQKEILRGPQAMLFPMSKREELAYAERPSEESVEPEEPAQPKKAKTAKDKRQAELDFSAPKSPISGLPVEEWANYLNYGVNQQVMYADDEVALVRSFSMTGQYVYVAADRQRRMTRVDIESYTGNDFTPEQLKRLQDAKAKAVFAESKRAAKAPDGPFTKATSNVVKSESVDQRYADYLREMMQSLGLGEVRVFLVHPEDVGVLGAAAKYNLYKDYASAQTAGESENEEGSKRVFGPGHRDFYISIKSGMSENKTLEVISHELGHAIQNIAFDNADNATKTAIYAEYNAWVTSTKGKTGRELVQMLRNRETADTQMESVAEGRMAKDMGVYWTSFSEWFADNVSKWASTAEKPVSIVEKFFSKVGRMMRDLVAAATGRKYPPAKTVANFLDAMGPDSAKAWLTGVDTDPAAAPSLRPEFSVSPSTEALVDGMGPLSATERGVLGKLIDSFKSQGGLSYATQFRTQAVDSAAAIEARLNGQFDGAVRDKLGKINPMGLYRQAQDYAKMLLEYFQQGAITKDTTLGLWKVDKKEGVRPPVQVYDLLKKWSEKNGYTSERGTQIASRVLEGVRLDAMRASNRAGATDFTLHLSDNQIDQLVAEYKADADLQEMSRLMDEARKDMVDNMVAVGRLTPEMGKAWKEVAGYVPFDRIDDFANNFAKVKKISNKGLAQVGKLPELVGSIDRPVGNVFDNYINTLGWMVGQTLKTDATVHTLRGLEDVGFAKFLGRSSQHRPNTVSMYVKGELMHWELPSKYDVMAFKDLNPPKMTLLRWFGTFSNILRKSVTILPPFALKQVTDDVQRAILTSGVRNPGALIRMSLTNFPKLAWAELWGKQHQVVRDFGALGLTGEYDFQAGKPAVSLLKDAGYKPRGWVEDKLHRLDGITRASDLAVRKAIYDQTMKETNDALLAQTRAREFINFRRRGASDVVGALTATIPFFNAYIQGMDVLYRAASGKDSSSSVGRAQARRMFWSRASTVVAMSTMYALLMSDDEDYQEMDLRTRNNNWIIPGGMKLPVPGELGALFKVIPETVVEYMKRQGTPEEQTAFAATKAALGYAFEQYVGRVSPFPQAIKPLLEAFTNHSFLTGKQLEGIYQQKQDPSMRRSHDTSELAIAIADFSRDVMGVEVSPIMVDNSLRGYFGSTAALTTMVTDGLLNPTRTDRPLHKWALLSNYLYDPVGTRRMTEFYEEREAVGRASATLKELMMQDTDRALAYAEKHQPELALESAINSTLEQLERTRAYRKFLATPTAAESMSVEERTEQIQEVRKLEIELTRWVREAKAAVRN